MKTLFYIENHTIAGLRAASGLSGQLPQHRPDGAGARRADGMDGRYPPPRRFSDSPNHLNSKQKAAHSPRRLDGHHRPVLICAWTGRTLPSASDFPKSPISDSRPGHPGGLFGVPAGSIDSTGCNCRPQAQAAGHSRPHPHLHPNEDRQHVGGLKPHPCAGSRPGGFYNGVPMPQDQVVGQAGCPGTAASHPASFCRPAGEVKGTGPVWRQPDQTTGFKY